MKAIFPGVCAACNRAIQRGDELVDSGRRGPRGGKVMVHARCSARKNPAPAAQFRAVEKDGPLFKFTYQRAADLPQVTVKVIAVEYGHVPRFDVIADVVGVTRYGRASGVWRQQTPEQLLNEAIRRREAKQEWLRETHDRNGRMTSSDWAMFGAESAIDDGLEQAAYVAQSWKPGLGMYTYGFERLGAKKNPKNLMIPLPFPASAYQYGPDPQVASWTVYPQYSYEQFTRENPRARRNFFWGKSAEKKVERRISGAERELMEFRDRVAAEIHQLESKAEKTALVREALEDRRALLSHLNTRLAEFARPNGLGRPVYSEVPHNAGPYVPQMYPFGSFGRPATYTTEPPKAKKNPRKKKQ